MVLAQVTIILESVKVWIHFKMIQEIVLGVCGW